MLRSTCCCLLLALAGLGQATAQKVKDDSQQTKLLVMEHLWNEAQVNRDARALNAMIGGEFVNTEYDGEVSDKSKFLADIKDPHFNLSSLSIQDLKVSMYADSAVVVGIYHTRGRASLTIMSGASPIPGSSPKAAGNAWPAIPAC